MAKPRCPVCKVVLTPPEVGWWWRHPDHPTPPSAPAAGAHIERYKNAAPLEQDHYNEWSISISQGRVNRVLEDDLLDALDEGSNTPG